MTRMSPSARFNRRQSRGLILSQKRIDDFVQRLSTHHLIYLVEGQVDAMVGNSALGEIVGADPL
jgi:hypothetical protein